MDEKQIDVKSELTTKSAEISRLLSVVSYLQGVIGGLMMERAKAEVSAQLGEGWTIVATPPDADLTVLLALTDGEVWPGFLDGDTWRYVTADPIEESRVTHWMNMPRGPVVEP